MPDEIVKPAALLIWNNFIERQIYLFIGFKPESSEKKYVHSDNLNHLPPPNFSYSAFFLA